MLIFWCQQPQVRLFQPLVNHLNDFQQSESLAGNAWIRCDTDKSSYTLPRQTYN